MPSSSSGGMTTTAPTRPASGAAHPAAAPAASRVLPQARTSAPVPPAPTSGTPATPVASPGPSVTTRPGRPGHALGARQDAHRGRRRSQRHAPVVHQPRARHPRPVVGRAPDRRGPAPLPAPTGMGGSAASAGSGAGSGGFFAALAAGFALILLWTSTRFVTVPAMVRPAPLVLLPDPPG